MNYRAKRRLKGLTAYTVAKELGVDYNKYVEVEKGLRPLESQYVDKFQYILRNAGQLRLAHTQKIQKVKESIIGGSLRKQIKDWGYSHKELGEKLGLSQGAVSNVLTGNMGLTSEDTMERIYDFVHEPFNKKLQKKDNGEKVSKVSTTDFDKINKWYNSIDLEKEILKHGFTKKTLARFLGVSDNHTYSVLNGNKNLSMGLKMKLYEELQKPPISEPFTTKVEQPQKMKELEELLDENNISHKEFAKQLGVTKEHFNRVLEGKKNASNALLDRIDSLVQKIKDNSNEEKLEEYDENLEQQEKENNDLCIEIEDIEEETPAENESVLTGNLDEDLKKLLKYAMLENERLNRQLDAFAKLIEKI